MNPTEKENFKKKIMTPSLKTNLQLGSKIHTNAGLGSKVQKQSHTVSKFELHKIKPSLTQAQPNEMTKRNSGGNKTSLEGEKGSSQQEELKFFKETFASNIPMFPVIGEKTKRKFTEIQKEKEEAKKASLSLIDQFTRIYDDDQALKDNELFLKKFTEAIESSRVINFSQLLPQSLDQHGSCLLEHSKFFLSFIKYKFLTEIFSSGLKVRFPLEKYIQLVDNCLNYDQDDLKLIYYSFIKFVRENYTNQEIMTFIQKRHPEETQILVNFASELNENHFKFLLMKPENFLKFELDCLMLNDRKGESESKKKKNTISSAFKSKKNLNTSNMSLVNAVEGLDLSENFGESKVFENAKLKTTVIPLDNHPLYENNPIVEEEAVNVPQEKEVLLIPSAPIEEAKDSHEEAQEENKEENFADGQNEEPLEKVEEDSKEEEKLEVSELKENYEEGEAHNHNPNALAMDHSLNLNSENRDMIETANFPMNIEEISPVEAQSYTAHTFYNDLVNKNKQGLEIENVSLTINKKTPKKVESLSLSKIKVKSNSPFALIDNDRFSIFKIEEEPRNEIPQENDETEVVVESRVRSKKQKKSNLKKEANENLTIKEEVQQEEKEKVVTRNMKNKKRYQSDNKIITKEESEPEEEPQPEPEESLKKDKKKKDNRRKTKSKAAEKSEQIIESEKEEPKVEKPSRNTKVKNKKNNFVSPINKESEEEEIPRSRSSLRNQKHKNKNNNKKNSDSPVNKDSEEEEELPRGRSSLRNQKDKNKNNKKVSASPSAKESEEEEEKRPKRETRAATRKEKSKPKNADKSRRKGK